MNALPLSLAISLLAHTALAATLHVAPGGNDSAPGTAAQPLATLSGARDTLRRLRDAGPGREDAQVILAEGEYAIAEPLVLESQDSGVTFEAAPGARASITGGRHLTG